MNFNDLLMTFISSLILIISIFVSVAFLTLLERKVLGYIQIRKGPNKVGLIGLPQPFSDAIKLFTKEQILPLMSNYLLFYLCPIFSLFLSLFSWMLMPYFTTLYTFDLSLLFFLCCTSFSVYGIMLAGWSSNSMYSMLGSLRSIAQTISYEVMLSLLLLCFIFLIDNYSLKYFNLYQMNVWFLFLMFPLSLMWFSCMLAETNRTPFDFAEGESELVSGFNVEYSGGGFALIFLAEYSSILFMSMLFTMIFLGGDIYLVKFYVKLTFVSFMFIWIRGTLPRYRYDKLMYLCWKSYLPMTLNYLLMFMGLKIFIYSLIN
uniref:NADH-ubiquinone oxidoreductase chain 1 n=1 Tax=Pamphilius sp. ZJUH_2016023 TaxID=2491164 RepID=A0A3Q8UA74_9HYME|nr:NADH dehydrogenase subunit 1 [Pamphilius sp. ZJUH_2016023]